MNVAVIIPARYQSSRFPGKPLKPVAGVPMVQRVWAIAKSVPEVSDVIVSTDHDEIESLCRRIGASCHRTSPDLRNGTERVAVTAGQLPETPSVIINLQGDAVLTPPWVIQDLIRVFMTPGDSVSMATPATAMSVEALESLRQAKAKGDVGGTTVVFDRKGDALYFSKTIIPYQRSVLGPVYRHIGLYAYTPKTLAHLQSLPPGVLEQQEQLEQLRALEYGLKIRVVSVDYRGRTHWGVDSARDLEQAEALIAAEGELLPWYDGTFRIRAMGEEGKC